MKLIMKEKKMGIKIKDYITEISRERQEALQNNKADIIIKAGELHARCGDKKTPSLVQCCSAMKQCMLAGDEIICNKENKTGASAALTIKYHLQDMEYRKPALPLKKRGRPAGAKNKQKEGQLSDSMKADEINRNVEGWMRKEHIKYEAFEDIFKINDTYGLWIIAKYQEEPDNERFLNTLKLINDDTHKCTAVFKDIKHSRNFWNEMSEEVLYRLNLTALFVADDGTVTHLI